MKYFYIYSAGGGAGDWNGVKRVWSQSMPSELKKSVLIKFGDIFFNHASAKLPIKPKNWVSLTNARDWLSISVNDPTVKTSTEIILDNGTSKLINFISHGVTKDPVRIIEEFEKIIYEYDVIKKYADVIKVSGIDFAVSIDLPNTFKIRSQSVGTSTDFFNVTHYSKLIELCASYANQLYQSIGDGAENRIMLTVNGLWTKNELSNYLSRLDFDPKNIAVGALTKATEEEIRLAVNTINEVIGINKINRIHFLGCGGIKKSSIIKNMVNGDRISVDNSTPMNRAIDGNTSNTSYSGYFDMDSRKLYRINNLTAAAVLSIHSTSSNKYFSDSEMEGIIGLILKHQNGQSGHETYDARAKLSFHNHLVFANNAN
ncbi:hypothetical protein H0X10_01045 [Candidatus Saccharibacteria bacterium]|nr:hypothetical protein [Candidatus Saccharibacteria bacterium]